MGEEGGNSVVSRKITAKITEGEYKHLEAARGDKTISSYIRELVVKDMEGAEGNNGKLEGLLTEVSSVVKKLQETQAENDGVKLIAELRAIKAVVVTIMQSMPTAVKMFNQKYPEELRK